MGFYGYTTGNDQDEIVQQDYSTSWLKTFNQKILNHLLTNKNLPELQINDLDGIIRPKTDNDPNQRGAKEFKK